LQSQNIIILLTTESVLNYDDLGKQTASYRFYFVSVICKKKTASYRFCFASVIWKKQTASYRFCFV